MDAGGGSVEALAAREAVSNVLFLATSLHADERACCRSLGDVVPAEESAVIGIVLSQGPERWVRDRWDDPAERPSYVGVVGVAVGDRARPATGTPVDGGDCSLVGTDACTRVTSVPSPGHLSALGVRITEHLDDVRSREEITTITLCFRSLSPLFVHAEYRSVFRLLSVLTGQMRTEDALAHYHLDPAALDGQDVARLRPLFDAVVELTDDGGREVTVG